MTFALDLAKDHWPWCINGRLWERAARWSQNARNASRRAAQVNRRRSWGRAVRGILPSML